MTLKPLFKKILRIIGWLFVVFIIGFFSINIFIIGFGKKNTKTLDTIEPAPVAIVLGAAVLRDKTMSPVLADRAQAALQLYQSGKVSRILVSGASRTVENDEVSPVRRFLVSQGVSPEDIFLDHAGFSTYDSMYRAKYIFEISDAIIVTQRFHLARALFIAHQLGINSQGFNADRRIYLRKNYVREWFARPYSVWQTLQYNQAEKMGTVISLDQDGQVTWQ